MNTVNGYAAVYCDGGVARSNPSKIGGSWAYVHVVGDECVSSHFGYVTPKSAYMPHITNNYVELLAAVYALESMPNGWNGKLYTDSSCTLKRIRPGKRASYLNIPTCLLDRLRAAQKRLGRYKPVLLKGHPTKANLAKGVTEKGILVSKWNVLCDKMCKEEIKRSLGDRF